MEEDLYERIGEADLNPTYKDGQVYQHTDINNMLSILKTAVNENYYDIQRLENGEKIVGNANALVGATLSRYLDEMLQADDDKIPSSQQVKAYVDALFSSFSPPIRGVDYWTEEDQQQIADEVPAIVEQQIEDMGPLGFNLTGNYDDTITYHKFDVVYYQGSTYAAKIDTIGNLPTNSVYWDILAIGTLKQFTYNSVAEMKLDNSLEDGIFVETAGYYSANDGGAALYKIRYITNEDDVDEMFIIALDDNTLVAELIRDNLNVLQLGFKNDGSVDCSTNFQDVLENKMSENETILFPDGLYLFNSPIDMTNCRNRIIKGEFSVNYIETLTNGLKFNNCSGFINCNRATFEGLLLNGTTVTSGTKGFQGIGMRIIYCNISNFDNGINGKGLFTRNTINRNKIGITGCVDSRIINNTINANNEAGISLYQGCNDNIISENKIEWNERNGISTYITAHNIISNNIVDRNRNGGIVVVSSDGEIVANNFLRRNGLGNSQGERSNLYIQGCTNCVIIGNSTAANNSQDDGSGTIVPLYAIEINTSSNSLIIDNNLTGGTATNPVNFANTNSNVRILDATYERMEKYTQQKTINSNGGTNTFEIHCIKTGDYSQPNFHKLIATCRTGSDGDYGFLEFYAYNYKQYGTHRIKLSNDTINSYLTMSASYDSDEDKYYITITNSSTSQNFNVQLYEY